MASHRQPDPAHDDGRVGTTVRRRMTSVAAEREDAAREQRARQPADTSGSTRDRQADHEAAHEKFGGMNLGACFFGWLVAIAVTVLLTGIVGAIVAAISSTTSVAQSEAERQAGTISIAAEVTLIVVLMLAYYAGGYVAGRMSRFDGTKQGIGVWVLGLIVTILAIGIGAIFGSQYNILDRVQMPRIPVSTDELSLGWHHHRRRRARPDAARRNRRRCDRPPVPQPGGPGRRHLTGFPQRTARWHPGRSFISGGRRSPRRRRSASAPAAARRGRAGRGTARARAPASPGRAPAAQAAQPPGGRAPGRPAVVPRVERGAAPARTPRTCPPASTQSAILEQVASGGCGRGARRPGSAGAGGRTRRPRSTTTADSSESWVQDRRLKLSEPIVAQASSMTQTLACT